MVRSLAWFHLHQKTWDYWTINKPNVPIVIILDTGSKLAFRGHIMYYLVLSVEDIEHEPVHILLTVRVFLSCGDR